MQSTKQKYRIILLVNGLTFTDIVAGVSETFWFSFWLISFLLHPV